MSDPDNRPPDVDTDYTLDEFCELLGRDAAKFSADRPFATLERRDARILAARLRLARKWLLFLDRKAGGS